MALFPASMESERLDYERVHPDETDPRTVYEHANPDAPDVDAITEYVTWDPHRSLKATAEWIEACGTDFENDDAATYALSPASGERAGEFAGVAGIGPDWDRQRATLGIWLRKPFWGNGYSEERAGRMLELAFERLDLEIVAVSHDVDNENSRRAIERYVERYGGRKEGVVRNDVVIDGEARDSVRYSVSREEWLANR